MRITKKGRALVALLALQCVLVAGPAAAGWGGDGRRSNDREVAFRWNQLTQQTIPASAGALAARWYAIVHVAQFEAVNSIERRYTPFRSSVPASRGASAKAAAAQAAHDVLVALIPASAATYDAALAEDLAGLPPGEAAQGIAVGRAAAQATLEWATQDGFSTPPPPFAPPALPGHWQSLVAGGQAAFRQAPGMKPMTIDSTTQFLTRRYPELDSGEYATAFEEVKTVGSATSTVRTPEQTQLARLWATVITSTTQFAQWNNVARTVADARRYPLLETTRLLAMMNASVSDGLLTTMTGKFAFALWRPITAIRRANEDLNPATTEDTAWTTLVGTPPYPSYPGNVACLSATAAVAIAKVVGTDAVSFDIRWTGSNGNPDVVQSYTSFWKLALDAADARIYGGLHFRFDNAASQEMCPKIAEWAVAHRMRPRD